MLDFIGKLNWVDFLVIIVLAGGAFAGFQQGLIRYVLSWVALVVAFIVASQLKGPLTDALSSPAGISSPASMAAIISPMRSMIPSTALTSAPSG